MTAFVSVHWSAPYGCTPNQLGAQFTGKAFTGVLKSHRIQISMDGKGRFTDNIFIERLWRSVKHEEVYLKVYEDVDHLRQSLKKYFHFYNSKRPHQSFDGRTPDEVYTMREGQQTGETPEEQLSHKSISGSDKTVSMLANEPLEIAVP